MKVTISYDLDNDQDRSDYEDHLVARKASGTVADLREAFRAHRKYQGPPVDEALFHTIIADNYATSL